MAQLCLDSGIARRGLPDGVRSGVGVSDDRDRLVPHWGRCRLRHCLLLKMADTSRSVAQCSIGKGQSGSGGSGL